jgi:hypothetical protein
MEPDAPDTEEPAAEPRRRGVDPMSQATRKRLQGAWLGELQLQGSRLGGSQMQSAWWLWASGVWLGEGAQLQGASLRKAGAWRTAGGGLLNLLMLGRRPGRHSARGFSSTHQDCPSG